MASSDFNNGSYDHVYNDSSYTPSFPSSYPQQPYRVPTYAQEQYLSPSYSYQPYSTAGHSQQQSSAYAHQPSSYQQPYDSYQTTSRDTHHLSSHPMSHNPSTSSSNSSRSGFSNYNYPGSSNPTSPESSASHEIDVRYTITPSSEPKGPQHPPFPPKNDKPYACLHPNCRFRTAREHDLKRHMKNHFTPAPEDLFPCPGRNCHRVGDQAFKRKDHMMEHVAHFHDGYVGGKKVYGARKKGGSGG